MTVTSSISQMNAISGGESPGGKLNAIVFCSCVEWREGVKYEEVVSISIGRDLVVEIFLPSSEVIT